MLYNHTKRADIKIIYRVSKSEKTVYIIDFFPTEKDDNDIERRHF